MTNSRVHKCLVECQNNPQDLHKTLKKWECALTFETEQINEEQFRCVAILSDGVNQISASEYTHRSYYSYMRKIHALASLLGFCGYDEQLKDMSW